MTGRFEQRVLMRDQAGVPRKTCCSGSHAAVYWLG